MNKWIIKKKTKEKKREGKIRGSAIAPGCMLSWADKEGGEKGGGGEVLTSNRATAVSVLSSVEKLKISNKI